MVFTLSHSLAGAWWSACEVSDSVCASGHENTRICLWSLDSGTLLHAISAHASSWLAFLRLFDLFMVQILVTGLLVLLILGYNRDLEIGKLLSEF